MAWIMVMVESTASLGAPDKATNDETILLISFYHYFQFLQDNSNLMKREIRVPERVPARFVLLAGTMKAR